MIWCVSVFHFDKMRQGIFFQEKEVMSLSRVAIELSGADLSGRFFFYC